MKNTHSNRIWAFIIDMILVGLMSSIIESVFSNFFDPATYHVLGFTLKVSIGSKIFFYGVYFILFDLVNQGITFGKQLLKLRVLSEDGTILNLSERVIRTLLKLVSIAFSFISLLVYLLSDGITLHDSVLKTKTVHIHNE